MRKTRLTILIVTLFLLTLVVWWVVFPRIMAKEYAAFTRPDGHYRVVVVRMPVWPALMPGQSSDAPGMVRLYDRNSNLLHETKIEMVQLVDHVDWEDKRVHIIAS